MFLGIIESAEERKIHGKIKWVEEKDRMILLCYSIEGVNLGKRNMYWLDEKEYHIVM